MAVTSCCGQTCPRDQTHRTNPQRGGQLARDGPHGHDRRPRAGSQSRAPAVAPDTGSVRRGQRGSFTQLSDSLVKTRCQTGDQQVSPPPSESGSGTRKKGKAREGSSAPAHGEGRRKGKGDGEISNREVELRETKRTPAHPKNKHRG